MILAQDTVPDGATGYVLGAYLVFLALVLVYLAITAVRLHRLERDLGALEELTRPDGGAPAGQAPAAPAKEVSA